MFLDECEVKNELKSARASFDVLQCWHLWGGGVGGCVEKTANQNAVPSCGIDFVYVFVKTQSCKRRERGETHPAEMNHASSNHVSVI